MALAKKKDKNSLPDASQLRGMGVEELATMLADNRQKLMRARFQHATASLENTAELKTMRRQIARIATILNEKQERG